MYIDDDDAMMFTPIAVKKLPPAKYLSKMAYDCELERIANTAVTVKWSGEECDQYSEQTRGYFLSFAFGDMTLLDSFEKEFSIMRKFNITDQWVTYTNDTFGYTRNYADLMRANASRIGCASKGCHGVGAWYTAYFCVINQEAIQIGDPIYEIATDNNGAKGVTDNNGLTAECDPLISDEESTTSTVTSTAAFSHASSPESQSTSSLQSISQQSTTSWPFTTASTKSIKSTRQCVTRPRCAPAKSRKARAANFREVPYHV
ncbi:unnamed protein product [Cylicocyclus nassatus]|uniref:SCP domain-containing protein n=1 Tax=Cylicocyclus nassatus TaxID=53992 RepID=A0AA36M7U2_CYLNA|nr:unnamed protein product [Cylicocyclus nassatus]